MMFGQGYWAAMGTFYLILLTIKDYKNGMKIDDRYNWLMYGATFSLLSHVARHLWFVLVTLALVLFMRKFLLKYRVLGEGDINALTWIWYGFGIINPYLLLYFVIYFSAVVFIYMIIKRWIMKIKEPMPFFGVLLVIFWSFNFIFGNYQQIIK